MVKVKRKGLKRIKDKGAAMVMVIVAIAFIGMLVAMVLYMSYANYLMKNNDRRAKDNFYTAESVLDIINVGLQKDVSDCMAQAYVKVMQRSSDMEPEQMTTEFRKIFVERITSADYLKGADANHYNQTHLTDMWKGASITVASALGQKEAAYLGANGDHTMVVSSSNTYVKLQNLHIVYTDAHGFVSIIDTDIRIDTPELDFAESTNRLTLENYSLIANTQLVTDGHNATAGAAAGTYVTGSVFGGYDGIMIANDNDLTFKMDPNDAPDPSDPGAAKPSYNLAADNITIDHVNNGGKKLQVDGIYKTYVSDINVNSSNLDLDGETYVSDDMDISGRRSNVTLKGSYVGYGYAENGAKNSSSILINGADTTLDFTDLENLMLSGHAFVGAMKYDADKYRQASAIDATLPSGSTSTDPDSLLSDKVSDIEDYNKSANEYDEALKAKNDEAIQNGQPTTDSVPQNLSDVMMGESITVKANQLLYMVPTECVGFLNGTNTQVISKNPMTYEEYNSLLNDEVQKVNQKGEPVYDPATNEPVMEKKYEVARLDLLWAKLGGTNYTDDYKAVFRRVNGTVMVYLYLDFENEQTANMFYRAYLENDPDGVSNYVTSYVRSISWPESLKAADRELNLAGNAFDLDRNNKVTLIQDKNDNNHTEAFLDRINANEDYSRKYESLMHSTSDDYTVLSVAQENNEIFDNYVATSDLMKYKGVYTNQIDTADPSKDVVAVIEYFAPNAENKVTGSITYPSSGCPANTHAIITNGDVYVKGNFEGLILAKGTIYIGSGCSYVRYNPTQTVNAFRAKKSDGVNEYYAYEVFGTAGKISYALADEGDEAEDTEIKLVDLISYENWKKD